MMLYLHGFCSSPASWKARIFREKLAALGLDDHFACPQLPPVPNDAIAVAEAAIVRAHGPVTLVGSSLGGHYANHLAEKHGLNAVLVNPAVISRLDVSKFVGEHGNFHTGERFVFTLAHARQLQAQIRQPTPGRYWLLAEMGDEVLDWRQAAKFYAGCRQTILDGGDHSFTQFPEYILQIIEFAGL